MRKINISLSENQQNNNFKARLKKNRQLTKWEEKLASDSLAVKCLKYCF